MKIFFVQSAKFRSAPPFSLESRRAHDQHGKDFKPSCQHVKRQHQLGQTGIDGKVLCRPYLRKTRTNIVNRRGHRRKIRDPVQTVQRDQQTE